MSGSARSATGFSHISTPDFRSPDFYALFVLGHPVFPALLALVRPVPHVYCDMYCLGFCSVLRCCFNHFVASHLYARTIPWTLLSSLISLCASFLVYTDAHDTACCHRELRCSWLRFTCYQPIPSSHLHIGRHAFRDILRNVHPFAFHAVSSQFVLSVCSPSYWVVRSDVPLI